MLKNLTTYFEIFLVGILAIGLFLLYLDSPIQSLINISLGGLAITIFLMALIPSPTISQSKKSNLMILFGHVIIPKVLYISSAIGLFGILIYNLDLPHDGHLSPFYEGGGTIFITLIISIVPLILDPTTLKPLIPAILRGSIVLISIVYFEFELEQYLMWP